MKFFFSKKLTWLKIVRQIQYDRILRNGCENDKMLKYQPNNLLRSTTSGKHDAKPNDVHNRHDVLPEADQSGQHHQRYFDAKLVETVIQQIFDQ